MAGLTARQIGGPRWKDEQSDVAPFDGLLRDRVRQVTEGRRAIREAPDDVARAIQEQRHRAVEALADQVRLLGDATLAAFFGADKPRARESARVSLGVSASLAPDQSWPRIREAAAGLAAGEHPIRPFHWEIEFPEVFTAGSPGFDAIVGNPPFAGKNTLINGHRAHYLDWLQTVHEGAHGNADVAPNEKIDGVEWEMEALAALAHQGADDLTKALAPLPQCYTDWIADQSASIAPIAGPRRQETAHRLTEAMGKALSRIEAGIALLAADPRARLAFAAMNEAVASAARQRGAQGNDKLPADQPDPKWRPFQLAFILLNLAGLADKRHPDREIVDLLFFPTGGGKTEAYLGLAAWTVAYRRMSASGKLGAGVTVLMRYTLRLLTLDQLARAAGVVCALELMRGEPAWQEGGTPMLGTWPIEIGLYVGSAASPNSLGGKGNTGPDTAVTRIKRYQRNGKEAPAPIQACPWCGTPFT